MKEESLIILFWLGVCAIIVLPCLIFNWVMSIKEKKELTKETIDDKRLKQAYHAVLGYYCEINELYHEILSYQNFNKDIPVSLQNKYLMVCRNYEEKIEECKQSLDKHRYSTIEWENQIQLDTVEEIENYVIKNFFK